MNQIKLVAKEMALELCDKANLKKGQIVIIGCSSSEIVGSMIGTDSNEDVAFEVYSGFEEGFGERGVYFAAQCCEHLNRAVVVERVALGNYQEVNVVPVKKAGGSFATTCYHKFTDPIVIESIKADAGIDIGGTLIGMHLKEVAVPIRLQNSKIGEASIIAARTRPKFIGGSRAVYNENLL